MNFHSHILGLKRSFDRVDTLTLSVLEKAGSLAGMVGRNEPHQALLLKIARLTETLFRLIERGAPGYHEGGPFGKNVSVTVALDKARESPPHDRETAIEIALRIGMRSGEIAQHVWLHGEKSHFDHALIRLGMNAVQDAMDLAVRLSPEISEEDLLSFLKSVPG